MIESLEYIYPDRQLLIEVDRSSGHMKFAENFLFANDLNLSWGGKQRVYIFQRCNVTNQKSLAVLACDCFAAPLCRS
jgi:hypothetical protein